MKRSNPQKMMKLTVFTAKSDVSQLKVLNPDFINAVVKNCSIRLSLPVLKGGSDV